MYALRVVRRWAEVVVVTVALWIPLCAFSMAAVLWLLALASPYRPSTTSQPSELPHLACFLSLILANYLAQTIAKSLEGFWSRRGW